MSKTKTLATICYYMQLHKLAYFLNRKRKRIVTFHNVLPDDIFESNVANGVSNSLTEFRTIIDEIAKRFGFSLDIDDPKTVTITFDDGYRNQVEVAGKYLLSRNIPAVLFVSGRLLASGDNGTIGDNTLIIDLLLHWISYAPNGSYSIAYNGNTTKFFLMSDNRLAIWSKYIWPGFKSDSRSRGKNLLDALDKSFSIQNILESLSSEYVKQRLEPASLGQYKDLEKAGWIIGWHTTSHYPLSLLSYEEKFEELKPNELCSKDILSFPYGGSGEVDEDCLNIAKQLGYKSAVSNVDIPNALSGKWFRSRMTISADSILLHFELSGLKHLLKYRKLLPKL